MKRLLAVLVALALLAGGFLVRDLRAGGGLELPALPGVGAAGDGSTGSGPLLCDASLAGVCEALAAGGTPVRTEDAATSVDRLVALADGASGDEVPSAWVTIAPWPQIVDEARARAGRSSLFAAAEGPALGSSPLVVLTWEDRGEVLVAACGSEPLLPCVGDVVGGTWADIGGQEGWGSIKPGFDDPAATSLGLAVLGAYTAADLETLGFGTRSLADGAYLDRLARLGDAVPDFRPTAGSPLAAAVLTGPSAYDVLLTSEAAARRAVEGSAQWGPRLRATTVPAAEGDGATVVDLVVAVTGGDGPTAETADAVRAAAAEAGWHTTGSSPDPLPGPAGPTSTLPSATPGATLPGAGALTALRTTFTDTVRR